MKKTIIIIGVSVLLILIFLKNCGFEVGNIRIGKQDDFAGNLNPEYQKSKFYTKINSSDSLYILNTWATWCAPCIEEFPIFEKLKQENKDMNFIFMSIDKDSVRLSKFLNKHEFLNDITFENIEYRNAILNTLNNKKSDAWISNYTVPETYFIKKGKVLKKISGNINYNQINELIKIYK
jgi:thiol-disulfide isomerase/thioredoxin